MAQDDGTPAHVVGDCGVFAFRVAGHAHAPPERQGAGVQALGECEDLPESTIPARTRLDVVMMPQA